MRLKRAGAVALSMILGISMLGTTSFERETKAQETQIPAVTEIPGTVKTEKEMDGSFLSVSGFASDGVGDRSQYKEGDAQYAVVENESEFVEALNKAETGDVKVIEIRSDLYMGWHELPGEVREHADGSVLEMSPDTDKLSKVPVGNPVTIESGISRITLQNTNGLTIFSTGGNTIYHAEFKFNSGVNDLVIRNLEFDEIWEWEDWREAGYGMSGGTGTGTRTGWSFIKINGADNVWIDHCNFGIAFDDNVGIENGSSGISITWCRFGDIDLSVGSMLYKTLQYMEALYQKSKTDENVKPFTMYSIMRDNGMTLEEIGMIMGYHSKCHMTGAGDKDTWLYKNDEGNLVANTDKMNANERLRLTLAYNSYISIGSRVPMLRSGVGHLYNCYTNNELLCRVSEILNSDPMNTGRTIMEQVSAKGGRLHPLSRGIDARDGASVAADTCVYECMDNAITGTAYHPNGSNISKGFENYWTYNYALIVNSSTTKYGKEGVYKGSSWDKEGDNPFINNDDYYKDAEEIIGNWSWGQEGDALSYEYQTFPLETVKENMEQYCGFRKINMQAQDWLKTSYGEDYPLQRVDSGITIPITDIRLSKAEATLYMQEEFLQLDAIAQPCNTTEKASQYEWSSSNPQVATVNDAGLVLPVSNGETTITVKTQEGLSATCRVIVDTLADSIEITDVPDKIYEGDIIKLGAVLDGEKASKTDVRWENSGKKMRLLDENNGIFAADEAGNNWIAAYSTITGNRVGTNVASEKKNLKILSAPVKVTGVAVDSEIQVGIGKEKPINATVLPADATNPRLIYEVSDTAVAMVDEAGHLVGVASGETVVTVTSVNGGYSRQCTVKVGNYEDEPGTTDKPDDVVKGDVDQDGKIGLPDAQTALKIALRIITPSLKEQQAADVNEDSAVTLTDAQLILKYALKIISEF